MQESEYNELLVFARNLLAKHKLTGMSFNENDLVNDVFAENPLLQLNEFKKNIFKKLEKERAESSILTHSEYAYPLKVESKVCGKCKKDLPIMLFNPRVDKGRTLPDSYCDDCRREVNKETNDYKNPRRFLSEKGKQYSAKINPICFRNSNVFSKELSNAHKIIYGLK
jgi:hypothetical protein